MHALTAAPHRAAASPGGEDRNDMIRRPACALCAARGRAEGQALDDWLQAQARIEQSSGLRPPPTA